MVTHPAFRAFRANNFIKFFRKYFDIGSEVEGGCIIGAATPMRVKLGLKLGLKEAAVEGSWS
jgi:hypothetical protein